MDASTKVAIKATDQLLWTAINNTAAYGVPKESILCVAELWRNAPDSGQVDCPINVTNTIMQTRDELELEVGPVQTDIFTLAELLIHS